MPDFEIQKHVEGTFYEIVAYFGSGVVLLVIGSFALVDRHVLYGVLQRLASLSTPAQILLLVVLGCMTYAYGQLASALSSPFIASPVAAIVKHRGSRRKGDFDLDFAPTIAAYDLAGRLPEGKRNNKWTLMFYLLVQCPDIGRDIIKRYAREKLARINSLNMMLLCAISAFGIVIDSLHLRLGTGLRQYLQVPNAWFVVLCGCLACVYAYEYYLRRCWNSDLLIKVLPAIASVHNTAQEEGQAGARGKEGLTPNIAPAAQRDERDAPET